MISAFVLTALYGLSLALYVISLAAHVRSFSIGRQEPTRSTVTPLWTAFAIHTLALACSGWNIKGLPVVGMFQAMSFIAWSVALCFIFLQAHLRSSSLGVFILPFVVIFAALSAAFGGLTAPFGGLRAGEGAKALIEQMRGWKLLLAAHMATALFSYSCFAIAFAAGLMYLLLDRELHGRRLGFFSRRMPPLEIIDKMNTHATGLGLTLLGVGIVSGAAALAVASGRAGWGDDAKIVTAALIWLAYAANLLMAARGGWRGRRAAAFSVVCFCMVFVLYFVVNLLFTRLHGVI